MNILITGTSSGVGLGLAKHYLKAGHRVYGISRNPHEELDKFDEFYFLSLDLKDLQKIENKVSEFLSGISTLDLVILNAGVLNGIKDLTDTTLDEIKSVMDINVWSNKILIDLLFEKLDEIKQLVAISSGASVSGSRGWNAYALSKAALNMLVELYSKEYTDCHFCALAPGLIQSSMQDYIKSLPEEVAEKFPVVQKLKGAYGTEKMPGPARAAEIISDSIEKALHYDSGSFLDVRKL